jgi:hypothetical protein
MNGLRLALAVAALVASRAEGRKSLRRAWGLLLVEITILAVVVTACGGAATTAAPTAAPAVTSPPETTFPVATQAPAATEIPAATLPPTSPPVATTVPTGAAPSPTAIVEERVVEVEWPPQMRLGDSDLIRLSLIPFKDGYLVTTEFADHQTVTTTVQAPRPGGYDLAAVARLDAKGFDFDPQGDQAYALPLGETVTWRWTMTPHTAGTHRLSLVVLLRWIPQAGNPNPVRETQIYSKGLEVRVTSLLGLNSRQAVGVGLAGLALGATFSLPLATYLARPRRKRWQMVSPNASLVIEPHPKFQLSTPETVLMRAMFRRYSRLMLEAEFRSGYSGARTILVLPVRADGRADAYTIAKIGEPQAIQREFENYETFVKDTLPPITARIQELPFKASAPGRPARPVAQQPVRQNVRGAEEGRAALRYTFIGEPGRSPTSLREALIANPDPSLLEKLFSTFGPNWWMQRRPYTFRLAQEYDRMLPAHYVLEPIRENEKKKDDKLLDGRSPPASRRLNAGDIVRLRNLTLVERRADGQSLSLTGAVVPGHPPLRLRWQSLAPFENSLARVLATREILLREFVANQDLYGLPDPLARLPNWLDESVMGTQSTIHGDLNLENILVGPGGFVWLIDFAQTRDGHPLYDFAHLAAEIIAHVIAPTTPSATTFLALLDSNSNSLLSTLRSIAGRCLFNPSQPREYDLALCLACLGALKFRNLDAHQKGLLLLAGAHLARAL